MKINVLVINESKIEEILKYLMKEKIPFEIVGRQALLLPDNEAYEKLKNAKNGWFDVIKVEEFPALCFREFKRKMSKWMGTVPDRFIPVNIPKQQKLP